MYEKMNKKIYESNEKFLKILQKLQIEILNIEDKYLFIKKFFNLPLEIF